MLHTGAVLPHSPQALAEALASEIDVRIGLPAAVAEPQAKAG